MDSTGSIPESAAGCDIGVLFVHGIGTQRRGETLASFANPVYRWIEECFRSRPAGSVLRDSSAIAKLRLVYEGLLSQGEAHGHHPEPSEWVLETLREIFEPTPSSGPSSSEQTRVTVEQLDGETVAARVTLSDARLTFQGFPDDSPSHVRLTLQRIRLDGEIEEERWLLAESWWAEAFSVPRFSELALWGLGVIPWTIGSHYGARVRDVWCRRQAAGGVSGRVTWIFAVLHAVLRLIGSLVLSLIALLALALILLFALLPIDRIRVALASVQQKIAASLGDSYVLIARPVQAAAIVAQVARDLDWLSQRQQCQHVVLLAHSQGAAVAHEVLRRHRPAKLRLLLTFGSGLRKLEELRYVLGPGKSFRKGAVTTLAGLLVSILYLFALAGAVFQPGHLRATSEEFGLVFFLAAVGIALLAAGLRDLVAGIELDQLQRRVERFAHRGFRWMDLYASADPVPNGPIFGKAELRHKPMAGDAATRVGFPESTEICNEKSSSKDHTSYWDNRDEFLSLLVSSLAKVTRGWPSSMMPNDHWLDAVRQRRRWRVGVLAAVRWIALACGLLSISLNWSDWVVLLDWAFSRAWRPLGMAMGLEGPRLATLASEPLWPTLGKLSLVLFVYWATRGLWQRWNEREMLGAIHQWNDRQTWFQVAMAMAIGIQLLLGAAFMLNSADRLPFLFVILPLLTCLAMVWSERRFPLPLNDSKRRAAAEGPTSRSESMLNAVWGLFMLAVLIWGCVALIHSCTLGLH